METMDIYSALLDSIINGLLPIFVPVIFFIIVISIIKRFINKIHKKHKYRKLKNSGIFEIDKFDGKTFENYLYAVFTSQGYKVLETKVTRDQGADLIIIKDGVKTVVQAKRHSSKISNKAVQEAVAAIKHYSCDNAMVVTNSYFTKPAIELAKSNEVELWNRNVLIEKLVSVENKNSLQTSDRCVSCDKKLTPKVVEFCKSRNMQLLCYDCQRK